MHIVRRLYSLKANFETKKIYERNRRTLDQTLELSKTINIVPAYFNVFPIKYSTMQYKIWHVGTVDLELIKIRRNSISFPFFCWFVLYQIKKYKQLSTYLKRAVLKPSVT